MTDIKAFRGLRYNFPKAGNPQDLITPPYDVISLKMQEDFYNLNPHNIIRLEWGKKEPDEADNNRYTRAAADFEQWQKEQILQREEKPAFYFYTQEFKIHDQTIIRSGFIATIKAEGYAKGNVLPHEETLPKHKMDRLQLMRHTYANFSPILGLFAQKEQTIDQALKNIAGNRPADITVTDIWQVIHRIWVIDDRQTVDLIEKEMADLKVYIADGHHRYETASAFAEEAAAQGKTGCDYLMLALINLYDPGLVVFPTHRLVKSLQGISHHDLLSRLTEAGFTIMKIEDNKKEASLVALLKRMAQGGKATPSFGLYIDQHFYLLQLNHKEKALKNVKPEKSLAYRHLDVTILHSLILENILHIGEKELSEEGYISYTRDNQEAISAVDKGESACAFLMNSTLVEELLAVAEAGEKMPQKSTYFFPKVIAGLVINKLGE